MHKYRTSLTMRHTRGQYRTPRTPRNQRQETAFLADSGAHPSAQIGNTLRYAVYVIPHERLNTPVIPSCDNGHTRSHHSMATG
eukprot:1621445-Rhodomonas_salina.3